MTLLLLLPEQSYAPYFFFAPTGDGFMQKNTASQKWRVFAFDRTDNTPKTGDAANITAKISLDFGAAGATDDTNPTEIEDGYYEFTLTQAETNANDLLLLPESATSNIQVIGCPPRIATTPAAWGDDVIQTGDSFARIGATGSGLTTLATAAALAAAQTDLDTITDTGVTAVALTTAAITDVWSTDTLTESYAADGAAATPAQLFYMIWSLLAERSIASTTLTAKKLDGSTTSMTFTLDSTTPTSQTRAT